MSLKRYIANCSNFSIFLPLEDNREVKLYFDGKDTLTKQRFVDVSDPEIQKALESSKSFGIYFEKSGEFDWLENVESTELPSDITTIPGTIVVETEATMPTTETKESKSNEKVFGSLKEGKQFLLDNHGIPIFKTGTLKYLKEEFEKLGYSLKIN